MSKNEETREESLIRVAKMYEQDAVARENRYLNEYYSVKRGFVLGDIASLPEVRGLKCYFIDDNSHGLKQNFYVSCKLLMASQKEAEPGGNVFAAYQPFLYGLLSDSPEIYDWLAHAELKDKDYVKGPQFMFHQFQLVLLRDDEALRETISIVARKGGNRVKKLAAAGQDFFSLLLKQDKEALQAFIEDAAKAKYADEWVGQFLAGFAVIFAKLCWYRGIEVKIQNPLVPMSLIPIQPLHSYDVEYDFLRPGWTPPTPPGVVTKIKRWFRRG